MNKMARYIVCMLMAVFSTLTASATGSLDELLQSKDLDSLLGSPTAMMKYVNTSCSQCSIDSSTKNSIKTITFTEKATQSAFIFTTNGNSVQSVKRVIKFRQTQGEQFFETIKDMLEDNGWAITVANLEKSQFEFAKTLGSKKITIDLKASEIKSTKKNTPKQTIATWEVTWVPYEVKPTIVKKEDTPIAPAFSKYLIDVAKLQPCILPNKLRWNITFNELEVLLKTNKLTVDTIFRGSGPLVGFGNIVSSTIEDKQEVQYTFNFQDLSLRSITKSVLFDDISRSKKAFLKLFTNLEDNGWSILEYSDKEYRAMFVNQCLPMKNVFSAITIGLSPMDSAALYITLEQMGTADIASFPQVKQRIIDIEKEESLKPCSSPHSGLEWGSDSLTVQKWLIDNGYRIALPINSRKTVSTFRYTDSENSLVNYSLFIRGNDFYRWQKERRFDSKADAQTLFKLLLDDAKRKYKKVETTDANRYTFKEQCATRSYIYTLYKRNDSTVVQELKSISPEIQKQELEEYQRLLFATRYYCELPSACTMPFEINRNATPLDVEKVFIYYGFTKSPTTGDIAESKGVKSIPFFYGTNTNEQIIVSFSNAKIVQFEVRATFVNNDDFQRYITSISQQLGENFSKKDIVSTTNELTLVKPECDVLPTELEIQTDSKKRQFRWTLKLL
jgi:hypothetical protein